MAKLITEDDRDYAPVSTAGHEEAYGRCDWHDQMALSPASPAGSPPHIPNEQSDGKRVVYKGKGKARAESGVEYFSPKEKDAQYNKLHSTDSDTG